MPDGNDIIAAFDRQVAALREVASLDDRIAASHRTIVACVEQLNERLALAAKAYNVSAAPPSRSQQQRREQTARPGSTADVPAVKPAVDTADTRAKIEALAKSLGPVFERAFSQGRLAIQGMVDAADGGSAMDTFRGSVTMLSGSIGEAFIPYVTAASAQVQAWARSFQSLDGDTKATVARVTLAIGAIGGISVAVRTLTPLVTGAALALRTLSAAAMSHPVGALVSLTAAVAGLAYAWSTVSKSSTDAGRAQRDAAAVQPGAGPQAAPVREYTPAEVAQLPAPYRAQMDKHAADEARVPQLPADKQQAERDRIAAARRGTVTQMERDTPAWVGTIPEPYRSRLQKPDITADQTREVVSEFLKALEAETDKLRGGLVPGAAKEAELAPKRQAFLEAELPAVRAEYDKRLAEYRKRVGPDAPGMQPTDPEHRGLAAVINAAREAAIKKAGAAGIEISPEESRSLRLGGTMQKPVEVAPVKPRNVAQPAGGEIAKLEAQMSVMRGFAERIGAKPGDPGGFLQNFKSPVASRWTDPASFQESAQLAVLNQGSLDAQNLADQMRRLYEAMGTTTRAIQDAVQQYQRSVDKGTADTFLRGWVDLSR